MRDLKSAIGVLPLKQLKRLDDWLHEIIACIETERSIRKRAVTQERTTGGVTYRLEGVRCGKEKCKCVAGELHGPYWYSYWTEGGRTKSQYVGKNLPSKQK